MSREIKFRAWDKKDMLYEGFHISAPGVVWKWINMGTSNETSVVLDAVVMQFTGLKDDNEIEIYEGDIIMDISGNKYAVEWNDDILRWQLSNGDPLNYGERYGTYKVIVANIFENINQLP